MGLVAAILAGCSQRANVSFPDHLEAYPSRSQSNATAQYMEVAELAEKHSSKLIAKVSFNLVDRRNAIAQSAAALEKLASLVSQRSLPIYSPYSPLAPPSHRRGWRFIGHVLRWKIESHIATNDYKAATSALRTAIRFGFAVSAGDSYDANLGYAIIQDAMQPVWENLERFPAASLRTIFADVRDAINHAPSLEVTASHEMVNMLKAVQSIQDAFLAGDLGPFEKALGLGARPAFAYLASLKAKDAAEQASYFEGFGEEAASRGQELLSKARASPETWQGLDPPTGTRPWWRLADAYFAGADHLPSWWLANQTRLRLLAIRAALLARFISGNGLPASLSALPVELRTDPYTGRDLMYVPRGGEFRLYSVGPDKQDNGGDGGTTGFSPDITLER